MPDESTAIARLRADWRHVMDQHYQQRRRTRASRIVKWTLTRVAIPLALLPLGLALGRFRPPHPPTVNTVWSALFVLVFACVSGGYIGGAVALTGIFGLVAVEILNQSGFSDLNSWLWWALTLLSYASVLLLLFRAEWPWQGGRRGPLIGPSPRRAFLQRLRGFHRRPGARRARVRQAHYKRARAAGSDFVGSAPRQAPALAPARLPQTLFPKVLPTAR